MKLDIFNYQLTKNNTLISSFKFESVSNISTDFVDYFLVENAVTFYISDYSNTQFKVFIRILDEGGSKYLVKLRISEVD